MSDQNSSNVYNHRVPWVAHLVVSLVILAVAFMGVKAMFSAKPEAKRWGGNKPAPSVAVETAPLTTRDYQVWIDSYGTVEPLTQTELVAEVTGRVVSVSSNIRAGGQFNEGDVLVQLDDRDFKVEVDIAASDAAQANVAYLQELAEADLAAKDWNKAPKNETARLLALRKPQVAAAKAALDAANARLARAKLNLERTRIKAPFDGMVLTQSIDIGQVVNSTQTIATIYSTDAVEVRLPVKLSELDYLTLTEGNKSSEKVNVALYGELGSRTYQWNGTVVRSEGAFDAATRTLFVVAQIDDPFTNLPQRPAIRVGQFLRAQIQGETLNDVFVIPRKAISQDYTVSVMVDNTLRKRQVAPLWTDKDAVVVGMSSQAPLQIGDRLILTPVSNLPDGTRIKALNDGDVPEQRERIAGAGKEQQAAASQTASSQ
jgi:RND family efflux transporter MFP subunit